MAAADAGDRGFRLQGRHRREAGARRRSDRLGHRRPCRHRRDGHSAERERPAPRQPVLYSRPADQSGVRLCLDQAPLKGPNHAVVTACSTGAHAIGDAARLWRWAMPTSWWRAARKSPICRICGCGLCRLPRAVDRLQRSPDGRPRAPTTRIATASSWARAPASSCSKIWSTRKARGARIYAEVIGYGMSGDAYHITAPAEDGDGAYRCMQRGAEARRASTPATSITSMRTAPRRRWATRSSLARSNGCLAMRRASSRCRRRSRRPGICWARRARSRRSSRCSPFATTSPRQR